MNNVEILTNPQLVHNGTGWLKSLNATRQLWGFDLYLRDDVLVDHLFVRKYEIAAAFETFSIGSISKID